MRLHLKIALALLLAGALPLCIVGGHFLLRTEQTMRLARQQSLLSLTGQIARECERVIMDGYNSILFLAENPLLRSNGLTPEELKAVLHRTQRFHPVIKDLTLVDTQGQVLASAQYSFRGSWNATTWFKKALAGQSYLSDVHTMLYPFDIVISVATPIYDSEGLNIQAVLVGQLDMDALNRILAEVFNNNGGRCLLVDQRGRIVATDNNQGLLDPLDNEYLRQALAAASSGVISVEFDKETQLASFSSLTPIDSHRTPLDGWRAVLIQPAEIAYGFIRTLRSGLLLAIGVSLLATALFSTLLSRQIKHRLDAVIMATRKLGRGEFDLALPDRRSDEIDELVSALSATGRQLAEYNTQIQDYQQELEKKVITRTFEFHRMNEELRQEIDERRRMEERLTYLSFHDPLTSLPNRALFMDRLQRAIERVRRKPGFLFSVIMLDLDRFKVVNDSLGHLAGDKLILAASRLIQSCVRTMDTVSRVGGDEFAVLLEELESPEEAQVIANRIRLQLSEPQILGDDEVHITASLGLVMGDGDYRHAEQLLRHADIAMYEAKSRGRNRFMTFTAIMQEQATHILQIENDMRHALLNNEFTLHYQPIVNVRQGQISAYEALIRWRHPERGLLYPMDFIPQAESSGLILPMGLLVLEQALRQYKLWAPRKPGLNISVNLSARQLAQPDLADEVRRILEQCDVSPSNLTLEITESVVMENASQALVHLTNLHNLGVRLAIDDFGMGYSSLSYLHQFPVDLLKIDRSFVQRMLENEAQAQLVRTIIQMGHTLGLEVLAEGVEEVEQYEMLRDMGCELIQGYYIARPSEPADAGVFLSQTFG